jgi:putative ABC transport system permease protein
MKSMQWFDSARARLRLLFGRRAAESRMNAEFRFHIEMETDRLMRAKGLAADEARRQALAAFGGVETHKEALRDGRGAAWLSGLSLDAKLGGRMLLKYPGLTLAGGLALAIAIGIGAGWYDLTGKFMSPTIPLPEGDRLVRIETQNTLTTAPEPRVLRDFLEWRRELHTIADLGAYRTDTRTLVAGNAAPEPIEIAELTAAAFGTARVPPLLGRALLDSDDLPGAPSVVVLGYDVWQRALGMRQDVLGSVVKLGNTPATVIGVMPKGFAYPFNHDAWTPLSLRASYEALEGGAISVIGRLAPGVSRGQANAELRVFGERTAAAFPATHEHLRPNVWRLAEGPDVPDNIAQFAMKNLPVLLVLLIACTSVGTLVYARTATREGEMAVRSALGASRARIIGQLFVEALVLASVAAAAGLIAADRAVTWVIENMNKASGGLPFWMTPGLKLSTMLYAGGLAVVSAAMLSLLPALKVTRSRVQPHLVNQGSGGATLRFGRVWTGAMIVQVALTAIGIPGALENASHAMRKQNIRAAFPSREYLAARIDMNRSFEEETTSAFEARRARTFAELQRRIAQEPGVVAVTFADRVPGVGRTKRSAEVESSPGAAPAYGGRFPMSAVGPGFLEALDRPIVAGRAFHAGDWHPGARAVIVNETFAREYSRNAGRGSPIGARLRYAASSARLEAPAAEPSAAAEASADKWFEIVGVVRDVGLDPNDEGDEPAFVFYPASAEALSPLVITVRMRGNPAPLAARLPFIAADVDARLLVQDARPLSEWVRDTGLIVTVGAEMAVTALVLFLSTLGIFSLMSVSVSRRTREIGLRSALGANPRHVLAGVLWRGVVLMGSGITAGGALLLLVLAVAKQGPTGRPAEDVALFAGHFAVTSAVMLAACLLACIGPARRALRINPTDALREA